MMGFDSYDEKRPPVATHQCRAVIIIKEIRKKRYYADGAGGWTTSPAAAFKYHNFRTAIAEQQILGSRGSEVTLTRKYSND